MIEFNTFNILNRVYKLYKRICIKILTKKNEIMTKFLYKREI